MYFNRKYLTTAGKNLLDQALSGSTIIWGKCATSSLNFADDLNSDVSQVRTLTDIAVSGKYTSLGTVTNVNTISGDENSNLAINCSVTNASNANVVSGAASAFGVWAKIGSGGTETLVAVAFFDVDGGTPETIPSASQSAFSATVDLYVKTSDEAVSTIASNPSWMTPLDDFNNLKNRVVTTHSANSTSTGDAQTIKGVKTFDDEVSFNDIMRCYNDLYVTGSLEVDSITANSLGTSSSSIPLSIGSSLVPSSNNLTLGDPLASKWYSYVYTSNLRTSKVQVVGTGGEVEISYLYGGACIDGDFIPTTNKQANLGLTSKEWGHVYSYEIDVSGGIILSTLSGYNNKLSIAEDDGDIWLGGFTSGHGLYLGQMYNTSTSSWGDRASLYAGAIYCDSINSCENISGHVITEEEDEMRAGESKINIEADSIYLKPTQTGGTQLMTEDGASSITFSDEHIYLSPGSNGYLYINSLRFNDSDSRAELANSLAGDSSYNPIGCMRLVAVQTSGPSGSVVESTYIRAGTVLSGYSVYKATFRGGDSTGFDLAGGGTYPGTWKLLTDLTEQYNTIDTWNYALAVRIL